MKEIRTDMACELRNRIVGDVDGVRCESERVNEFDVFKVDIYSREGECTIGKPMGQYYTLALPQWFDRGSDAFCSCVWTLAELIDRCLPPVHDNVIVAALGNPDITPDALGSLAAGNILVTRHLKEKESDGFSQFCSLALCRPGVLGTSGIESAAQIQMLCEKLKPQLVVVIDALAGSEAKSLCRSIQVSNTGISPGSGVGNDRKEISRASLGVPLVSIGIPTVIDASFFGDGNLHGMFVTPRDIDSLVRHGAKLIAYAINLSLHHGLTIEDIDALTG